MEKKQSLSTKAIVMTALMAALTMVGSAMRIVLPLSIGGTTAFHLGNIFCALSGILLGPWLGGLAAGLGSAIYDILSMYIDECWITFLTKGAYGLAAGLVFWYGKKGWHYGRAALATTTGAVVYAVLYLAKSFFYNGMFKEGLVPQAAALTLVGKLPATIFNAVIAIICAPILALAIHSALKRNHLELK